MFNSLILSALRNRFLTALIFLIIVVGGVGGYLAYPHIFPDQKIPQTSETKTTANSENPALKTATPIVSRNFSTLTLAGTVQSYETAKVAARATGVVSDVLVELGDRVKAGQTLALMLPHGAEGAAAATTASARAKRDRARVELANAERRATAASGRSQTNLDTTRSTQTATIVSAQSAQKTAQASLAAAETALTSARDTRTARLAEADAMIATAADAALAEANSAYQAVHAALVTEQNKLNQSLSSDDLPTNYGALNTNARSNFLSIYNSATAEKKTLSELAPSDRRARATSFVNKISQLVTASETLIRATSGSAELTQMTLDEKLTELVSAEKDLNKMQRELVDATTARETMQKTEDAEVTKMESELKEKQAMVNEAESELSLSQSMSTRETELAQKELSESATEKDSEVVAARAELTAAEAELAEVLSEAGHTRLTAATSGVVARRLVAVGDSVMEGQALFELSDAKTTLGRKNAIVVSFGAPENLFTILNADETVEVILPGEEKTFPAKITRKSEQIDPMSRTFLVLAELVNGAVLPPNANVRVRVPSEKNPAWQISARAVKREAGSSFVWVLGAENKPTRVTVTLLAEDGEFADVRAEGLAADSKIVLDPPESFVQTVSGDGAAEVSPAHAH